TVCVSAGSPLRTGANEGTGEITAFGKIPAPVRFTFSGLPAVLFATAIEPLWPPVLRGVKITLKMQLAAGARLVPQLLDCAKSPVMFISETLSAALPVLLTVTLFGVLLMPTLWFPKSTAAAEALTAGAVELIEGASMRVPPPPHPGDSAHTA